MARPLIPGGRTEQVANTGGDALRLQLATLVAGHRLDHVVYAMTTELGGIALLLGDTMDEAKGMIDVMARDAKNLLELNWDRHDEVVAAASALGEMRRQ